eukprot:2852043-Prymnesium_polylepis.1
MVIAGPISAIRIGPTKHGPRCPRAATHDHAAFAITATAHPDAKAGSSRERNRLATPTAHTSCQRQTDGSAGL